MARRSMPTALLLSAGAGLVGALPHPQWTWTHHHHLPNGFPTFSFHGFPYPTLTPTGFSVPSAPGSSVAAPTGFSFPSGSAGPTGTGFSFPGTGTGFGYPVSSVGATGVWSISVPIGTGSSVVVSSSQPLSSSIESASVPQSSALSSLAAAASAPSDSASSLPASPNSSGLVSSAAMPSATSDPASASSSLAISGSVTASSGCTFTDADTAAASKGSCSTIVLSSITVPAGKTLDMTDLNDGTTVSFEGTTTFEFEEWDGPLISFSGKSITITGASGHVIDGNGAKWWDGEGSNGGKTKPKFFYAHDLTDSTISGLNIKNTPVQAISVDGAENLKIEDVTIDDSDGDTEGGHNTDCFDIGESTGVYLSGITCKNQDDCIAINSGTDIQFTGGTCSGGHGLSIGSVGGRDDNTVENVYIASSSISNSENGVRIKCNSGDTGSVKNVTYSGITLSGITDFGIVVEQDYENGSPTGTPTDGIPITDVTVEDITGSVTDNAQAYYILCAACSDWTVSGVDLTGGSEGKSCEGVPSGASGLC